MDPDPDLGGPKTCGSGGFGFGSATLLGRMVDDVVMQVYLYELQEHVLEKDNRPLQGILRNCHESNCERSAG
jgi:hypothetical protein